MAKVGFDVSQFVGPFRGNIAESIGWGMDANQARARNNTDFLQSFMQADMERARLRQADKLAQERAALLQAKYKDIAARGDARLALDRDKFDYSKTDKQRERDAQLVDKAGLAFAAGDENALLREIAKGRALDPSIQAQMPGEGQGLRIGRGDTTLYEGDPDEVQGRERSIATGPFDPLLAGPFGTSFQLGRGAADVAAGHGMTGREALEMGLKVSKDDQAAQAAQQRAQTMSGQRSAGLEMQQAGQDLAVRKFKEDAIREAKTTMENADTLKKARESISTLNQSKRLIATGAGLPQKLAAVGQLKGVMSGVLSDQDMDLYFGATGKVTQIEQALNNVGNRGVLPPEFTRQMDIVFGELLNTAQTRIMEGARGARDYVYSKTQVPWSSYEDLAEAGNQAQAAISKRLYTPEQMRQEVARLKQLYPGRFGGGSAPSTDFAERYQRGSGPVDNLGVTGSSPRDVPPIPQDAAVPPERNVDEELLDLLKEYENAYP